MPVEDLVLTVLPALRTTEKQFDIGGQRIELCLFLQLTGFTVNRPTTVLALRYRYISHLVLGSRRRPTSTTP